MRKWRKSLPASITARGQHTVTDPAPQRRTEALSLSAGTVSQLSSPQKARDLQPQIGLGRGRTAATELHPMASARVSSQQARVTSGQPAASRPQQQQRQLRSALRRVRGRRLQPLAPRRACANGGYVCAVAAGRVAASRHDQLHPGHGVAAPRPLRHGLRDGARPEPSHRMVCPTHYDAYSLRCSHCALTCVMVLNLRPRGDT